MPPKKGGKKGGGKSKTSTVIETAKTREDVDFVKEEKVIPRYLIDGFTQKDRDIVIDGYYMHTPNGKNELLRSATVRLVYGRHYGLIGQNGIGKSTLLNAISNYQIPGFPQHLRVVHVHQEEIPKIEQEKTVLEYVMGSDEQKNYLEAEEERLLQMLEDGGIDDTDNMDDFDEIQLQLDSVYQRLDEIGARTAEARVRAILTGLQFTGPMQDGPIKRLSGGWRMRVRLACALFVTPDILLLDEPTNHLDFPAVEWLASFLRQYEPTLLVVSHDRGFLDQVMTDCIDFRDKTLMYYRGDYTNYLKVRSDFIRTHNKLCDKIEKKRQALTKFISEARQKAKDDPNLADMAKTRQRVLDQLPVMEPIREDRAISFAFPDPGTLDHAIIQCNNMCFHYDPTANGEDKPYMLNNINAHVDMSSRIGIMGANGAGKTTLINVMLGKYEALAGKTTLNDQARAKIFTQHHLELLDENVSPLQFMMERFPQAKEGYMRGFLGRFGMDKRLAEQQIGKLSGGQKSRVSFAFLTFQTPHLIIMDEPTNHLDIETIESLIHALHEFKGGVIVISHDRYFLSQTAEEFWAVNSSGDMQTFYDLDEAKEFSYQRIVYDGPDKGKKKTQTKQIAEVTNAEDERLRALQAAIGDDDDDDDEEAMLAKMDLEADKYASLAVADPKKAAPAPAAAEEPAADEEADLDDAFAALAMEEAEAPKPAKKAGKKAKKQVPTEDEETADLDDAFASLAGELEEEAPKPKAKKGKKGKKVVEDEEADLDDAFAALAGDLEEEAPQPKKKGGKKAKKQAEEEDLDDDLEAETVPKKKGKKGKKQQADDEDLDDAFASLANDLETETAPKKKKGKKSKVVDEDLDDAFASLAADLGEDDAPKKSGASKESKRGRNK